VDRWYRNSVIYALDVGLFQDSNGDGYGDIPGLTSRLDYLTRLGVNVVWLNPVHPSPRRDGGYDITDYYGIDPRLGTLGDFAELLDNADERGLRIMLDLVLNHTSDEHPWFRQARADRNSPYRDWYVWSDTEPVDRWHGQVFPGVESETWTYDEVADAWFRHRFYTFEPDLNTDHPAVRREIRKILEFWLRLGVAGFRVEVDLERLTPSERREVMAEFGPDESMQLYQRGLRRRLAPMLDGDRRRLELAYSLQFTMPGTPVIRYGDEIGMGENLSLPERTAIRTPMQWSATANAGFSDAPATRLVTPVIDTGEYRADLVNVTDERLDPNSLLVWFERMLHTLRECEEIGRGVHEVLEIGPPHLLAHSAAGGGGCMFFLHNLADMPCRVALPEHLRRDTRPLSVAADGDYDERVDLDAIEIHGYGYRWIRLDRWP
jgi:glycosidase